jgi:hypothetical protein
MRVPHSSAFFAEGWEATTRTSPQADMLPRTTPTRESLGWYVVNEGWVAFAIWSYIDRVKKPFILDGLPLRGDTCGASERAGDEVHRVGFPADTGDNRAHGE